MNEQTTKPHPPIHLPCKCHGGSKTLHYFQRIGAKGPVYVCDSCGMEKTVK